MLQIYKLSVFIFIVLSSCNVADDSPYPVIETSSVSLSGVLKRATAFTFVINNNAYISQGRMGGNRSSAYNDLWKFDSSNEVVTRMTDFPGISRVGAVSGVVNGVAYCGLGFNPEKDVYDEEGRLDDFWSYNSVSNTWTQLASFPKQTDGTTAPVIASVSFVYQHYVYVLTDFDTFKFSKSLWRYNTLTDSWEQLKDFPGRHRTGAVACSDGLRFFYGTGFVVDQLNDWWEYFPQTDSWKQCRNLPGKGRCNAVAFSVNNRFYVATGNFIGGDMTDALLYNDVLEYDADKNVWYNRGIIPGGGRQNAICFVLGNSAYVGFGENTKDVLNDCWRFNP